MRKTLLCGLLVAGAICAEAQVGRQLWTKPGFDAGTRPDPNLLFKKENLGADKEMPGMAPKSAARTSNLPTLDFGKRVGYTAHDWQYTTSTGNSVVKLNDGSLGLVWQFGRRGVVGSRQIGFNYRNPQGLWCVDANAAMTPADSFRFVLAGDNALGGAGNLSWHTNPTTLANFGRTRHQFLLPFDGNTSFKSFTVTFGGGLDSVISQTRISDYDFPTAGCRPTNGAPLTRRSAVAYNPSLASDGANTIYGITYTTDTVGLGLPAFVAAGQQNPIAFIKSTDKGVTWTTKTIPNLNRAFGFGSPHTMGGYAIDAKGNQIAAVMNIMTTYPNPGFATILLQSFDGGETFTTKMIDQASINDTSRVSPISVAGFYACLTNDNHFSVKIAANDVVHVTTARGYLIGDSAAQEFQYGYRNGGFVNRAAGRLMYWNSGMTGSWVFPNGVNFVDTDRSGAVAFPASTSASNPGDYMQSAMSQSVITVDQQGRIYVVYSALVEGTESCCNPKTTRDIYVVASSDGGANWTNPLNVAALAGADDGVSGGAGAYEDVFPVINRTIGADDSLHIFWMTDDISGLQSNGVFAPGYTQANWRMNAIYNYNMHTNVIWARQAGISLPEAACAGSSFNISLYIPNGISIPATTNWTVQLDTSGKGWFTPFVGANNNIANTIFTLGTLSATGAPGMYAITCNIPAGVGVGVHKVRVLSNFQDPFDITGGQVFYQTGNYDLAVTGSVPGAVTAPTTNPANLTNVCPGDQIFFTSGTNNLATDYEWTLSNPGIGTIIATDNSALVSFGRNFGPQPVTVSVTPKNGCGSGPVASTTVNYSPIFLTLTGNVLKAPAGGTNHRWTLNGVSLPSSNGIDSIVVSTLPSAQGTYCLTAVGLSCSGCLNVAIAQGLKEANLLTNLNIFPNPAQGSFAVEVKEWQGDFNRASVTVLNALGQIVAVKDLQSAGSIAEARFSTDGMAKGIYMVRVTSGAQSVTRRLVVE